MANKAETENMEFKNETSDFYTKAETYIEEKLTTNEIMTNENYLKYDLAVIKKSTAYDNDSINTFKNTKRLSFLGIASVSSADLLNILQSKNSSLSYYTGEKFSEMLLRLIDESGKNDTEIYKKANIDRRLFSKIRNRRYIPSKNTAIALAIALELSLKETNDLLRTAGYTLSHSQKFDLVIELFIIEKEYNIFKINAVLYNMGLPLLGSKM